jgi:hypothetical protein
MLRSSAAPTALHLAIGIVLLLFVGACAHSSSSSDADVGQSNVIFEDVDDDNRETVLIEPADAETDFTIRPAVFDTALIRVDDGDPNGAIIEVLVKGSFPDGCSELHALDQEPIRGGQRISLTMRRPSNAICTQAVRPYRFFFTLDRRLAAGSYQLIINEHTYSFEVG